jgi:tripartite-type tricarboxylate transporter receptor subunit TctC
MKAARPWRAEPGLVERRQRRTGMQRITRRGGLAMAAGLLAGQAKAQGTGTQEAVAAAWPSKAVTIVAPFTPGGPVDVLARILAQAVQARTGQPAVVDNRTGGAGNIGIDLVRRTAPDGHTLLLVPAGNLTINPTLLRNLPFDVARDFTPVSLLASAPNVICAAPALGVTDLAGLLALGRGRAEGLTYGSPGVGSQLHLAGELLAQRTGVKLVHVPYRGSAQALADLLGGQLDLLLTNLPATQAAIRAGQVRAIALTTARRAPSDPEIPTLEEAGVPGFDITSWYGLLVPRATPAPVVAAIHAAVAEVLGAPAMRAALAAQGLTVADESQPEFAARIVRETAMWAAVIRERGIQAGD